MLKKFKFNVLIWFEKKYKYENLINLKLIIYTIKINNFTIKMWQKLFNWFQMRNIKMLIKNKKFLINIIIILRIFCIIKISLKKQIYELMLK